MVVLDAHGSFIAIVHGPVIFSSDAIRVEVFACREALQWLLHKGFDSLEL